MHRYEAVVRGTRCLMFLLYEIASVRCHERILSCSVPHHFSFVGLQNEALFLSFVIFVLRSAYVCVCTFLLKCSPRDVEQNCHLILFLSALESKNEKKGVGGASYKRVVILFFLLFSPVILIALATGRLYCAVVEISLRRVSDSLIGARCYFE